MGCLFLIALASGLLGSIPAQNPTDVKSHAKSFPVGQVTELDIFESYPEYTALSLEYNPDSKALTFLKEYPRDILIETFFGGWCDDSRDHVPHFLKVIGEAGNPHILTMFIGVDRQKQDPSGLSQDRKIERVPTFIVYLDGGEIGRIVETPDGRIEEHLVKILKSK